jgi:hypothetical protein
MSFPAHTVHLKYGVSRRRQRYGAIDGAFGPISGSGGASLAATRRALNHAAATARTLGKHSDNVSVTLSVEGGSVCTLVAVFEGAQ